MDITFACEACGQSIVIDEAGAGLTVQCPNCGQSLAVPKPTTAKSILAVTPTPIDPTFLYTLFRGRGPSKVTQIIGAQYFYRTREQAVDGPFNKLEMRGLMRKKIVEPETMVLCPATQAWLPCERFPELPNPAFNKLLHFQKDERFAALVKEIPQKIVDHIVEKISEADLVAWLVERIKECGYQCPDFDDGTINDLVSEERIKIIVEKNRQTWWGYLKYCQQRGPVFANPPELIGF
jgi:hypothetical protein